MIGIYGENNDGCKFPFLLFLHRFLLQIGMLKVSKYYFIYCLIFVTVIRFTDIQHSLGLILIFFNLIKRIIAKIIFFYDILWIIIISTYTVSNKIFV